jgi:hypothetical protein
MKWQRGEWLCMRTVNIALKVCVILLVCSYRVDATYLAMIYPWAQVKCHVQVKNCEV